MGYTVTVKKLHDREDPFERDLTPEQRIAMVEQLRLEAEKFLYDNQESFRRVVTVIRRKPR
jgi:hypothetical protein